MSGLKTHVTWLPVLANTRGCGSNFNCRQSSQPCGFNRKSSTATLPKMLGAALGVRWGLLIGSWFSNQSVSTGWNFSILLSFWCLQLGFICSTSHFCEDGGRSFRHLCEYRPPLSSLDPPGAGEASALLVLLRCLCDFVFLPRRWGQICGLNSYLLHSFWGHSAFLSTFPFQKRWRKSHAEFIRWSQLDVR